MGMPAQRSACEAVLVRQAPPRHHTTHKSHNHNTRNTHTHTTKKPCQRSDHQHIHINKNHHRTHADTTYAVHTRQQRSQHARFHVPTLHAVLEHGEVRLDESVGQCRFATHQNLQTKQKQKKKSKRTQAKQKEKEEAVSTTTTATCAFPHTANNRRRMLTKHAPSGSGK